ncbi:MAG: VRR-NUC domain-containing protein [Candidatus Marinimicrobia bacterium]|nr:VRR-NUC domain-containing protein [Candidatus Neomarinimicrobiota bacterium]
MAKIPDDIEVRKIGLERKVNPEKGWSEWWAGTQFYPDVEDAVLAYYVANGNFSGIRTTYRIWKEAFRGIGTNRKSSSNQLITVLRSLDSGATDALKSLIKSTDRKGAPDLLLSKDGEVYFAEVKVSDSLSTQQLAWLKGMISTGLNVFIVRVKPDYVGVQVTKDDYIIGEFEKEMWDYISSADNPEMRNAFAYAKRSLTNFDGYDINSALEFESRIHKLYTTERLEETFNRLSKKRED